jgi:hypothetical protein
MDSVYVRINIYLDEDYLSPPREHLAFRSTSQLENSLSKERTATNVK